MYAVIKSGGKQYRVKQGQIIDVELLFGEKTPVDAGSQVEFGEVLFIGDDSSVELGSPFIQGCVVKGEVIGIAAGPKITSIKYKPSHNEVRKFGHRQHYTRVKITEIAKA